MVNTLIGSNDNFVSKYYSAREILNLGHSFTKFRGTAKDRMWLEMLCREQLQNLRA